MLSLRFGLGPGGWLAGTGYLAAVGLGITNGLRDKGMLGPADKVTLARAILTGGVAALVAGTVNRPVMLIALILAALVLDGVDGQVARRTGTASAFGARFDMEIDASLILILSGYVALHFGPWVLAIGLMRYACLAAGRVVPWHRAPVPSTMTGKVVAVTQG